MSRGERAAGAAWALAAVVGVVCIGAFWALRIRATGFDVSFDHAEFLWPAYAWNAEQIRAGTLPLWNPFVLAGRPTLAALQSGLLYPAHLVYLFLAVRDGMAVSTVLHLGVAGAGAFWLARRLGCGPAACLLAALLLCVRGGHAGASANLAILESLAWLAPGFVAVHALASGRTRAGALGIAACVALSLLGGFPQMTVYAAYAWTFTAFAVPLVERRAPRAVALSAGACVAGVALGAAIAAVQLLPALELAGEGLRSREALPLQHMFPYGLAGYGSVTSGLARSLETRVVVPELWLGFGVIGLALVPLSLFARPQRAWTISLGLIALLTLGVAAGPASPVFDLYLALPELSSFRVPMRVLAVTDLCLAILAAIGLERALAWIRMHAGTRTAAPAAVGAAVVLAAAIEVFVAPTEDARADAAVRAARWAPIEAPSPALTRLRNDPARAWVWEHPGAERLPWRGLSTLGVRSLSDYDALLTRRESEYLGFLVRGETESFARSARRGAARAFYGRTRVLGRGVEPVDVLARRRLAEVAGAAHVLVERALVGRPAFDAVLSAPDMRPAPPHDDRYVAYEATRALPRAYVTHRVEPAPPAPVLLDAMSRTDFDPRARSYVEGGLDAALAAPDAAAASREVVRITGDSLHAVDLDVRLEAPGLVVLSDAHYPGWVASVDGVPATIHPTNHLFRGVAVEAGEHEVTFRYRPASVRVGALVSLVGFATWLALAWTGVRRGPRDTSR